MIIPGSDVLKYDLSMTWNLESKKCAIVKDDTNENAETATDEMPARKKRKDNDGQAIKTG